MTNLGADDLAQSRKGQRGQGTESRIRAPTELSVTVFGFFCMWLIGRLLVFSLFPLCDFAALRESSAFRLVFVVKLKYGPFAAIRGFLISVLKA
jgi:hypothetical protein